MIVTSTGVHDTTRLNAYYILSEICEHDEILSYINPIISISQKNLKHTSSNTELRKFYIHALGRAYNNRGFRWEDVGNSPMALDDYQKSLIYFTAIQDSNDIIMALNNIGSVFELMGNSLRSLEYYHKSLEISELTNNSKRMISTQMHIGEILYKTGNFKEALNWYSKCIPLLEADPDYKKSALLFNNISKTYRKLKDLPKALEFNQKSIKVYETNKDLSQIAVALKLNGYLNLDNQQYEQAERMLFKALKISEEKALQPEIIDCLIGLAKTKVQQGKATIALPYAQRALLLSEKSGYTAFIGNSYSVLSDIYNSLQNYKLAYEMQTLRYKYEDSINNINIKNKVLQKSLQYVFEKKSISDSLRIAEEKKLMGLTIKQEKTFTYAALVLLIITLIYSVFLFNRVRFIGKQKQIIEKQKQEVEEQREIAIQANNIKSEFVANISHEIRTPLNAVLGFSNLLKGHTVDKKHEDYLEHIITSGKNLSSLINDILDLSKIETGNIHFQLAPVNMRNLLLECKNLFSQKTEEKGLYLNIFVDDKINNSLLLDETRLRQILFNLLGNAIKFTAIGGINLRAELQEETSNPSKVTLLFKISDTGIGIPASQQKSIFNAYKQQDGQTEGMYGGTGLGLTITKRLVDACNGKILLESTPGKGSEFTVILPDVAVVATEAQELRETKETNLSYFFKGQNILLVEDLVSNRELIKSYLEFSNLNIIIAENGLQAINIMKHTVPDLIIMDQQMPVMDGKTAIHLIKKDKRLSHIPVFALTASGLLDNDLHIKKYCSEYILKPIEKNKLVNILAKYLDYTVIDPMDPALRTLQQSNQNQKTQTLKNNFYNEWKNISILKSSDDILNFSERLLNYANTNNLTTVSHYARELKTCCENFEVEKMYFTLSKFEELLSEKA